MAPPLDHDEVRAWLDALGPTDAARIACLRDLLVHAGEDAMSAPDRTLCLRELGRLTGQSTARILQYVAVVRRKLRYASVVTLEDELERRVRQRTPTEAVA